MKKLGQLIPLFLLCLGLLGCNNDPFVEEQNGMESGGNATVKEISVTLPEIPSDVVTRTEFMISDTIVTSSWVENDTIGIFPGNGNQVIFPIVDGAGTNTAIFDGGDWGLKAGRSYAAYYPFNRANFYKNNKTILMDYTGQAQEGNGNAAHLGSYDYLATGQVSPNSSGSLNLEMQRLGSLVMLELVVPESETYTSLTLISSESNFITKAELDISGPEPQITEKETSTTITLALKDVTLEAGDILQAYLMCSPVDLTSGTLSVALKGKDLYNIELEPKKMEAGKPYKFIGSYNPVGFIEFANSLVKQICVSQWDTNKDGELSYEEAARVTGISAELFSSKTITSFDELRYFTNLNVIGNNAFNGCRRLASVTIPENVTYIGEYAFSDCINLTSITLPDGVTYIGEYAFRGCSRLISINIPDGVMEIRSGTFHSCSSLTSITIPEGVTAIGDNTFNGCSSLTSINIPGGVTSIEHQTFEGCSSLTSITLPNGVTSIRNQAFYDCSSLTSINIPEGVTSFGRLAFGGCTKLTSIIIPDGVTKIDDFAFFRCISLTSINIPDGVTFLGNSAFYDCSSLTNITIPEGVMSIGESAFSGSGLTSITIPDGVTDIGSEAFSCSNLTYIIICATIPPLIGWNVFPKFEFVTESIYKCTIYVPASSVETYKADSGWSEYAHLIIARNEQ